MADILDKLDEALRDHADEYDTVDPMDELNALLDQQIFTDYYDKSDLLRQISTNQNLDLNQHKDFIQRIAMFTFVETMTYWNKIEKGNDHDNVI